VNPTGELAALTKITTYPLPIPVPSVLGFPGIFIILSSL